MLSQRLITNKVLIQRSIISGGLYWLGDFIAQTYIEKNEEFHWRRSMNITVFGTCIAGPFFFNWLRFLDRTFPLIKSATTPVTATGSAAWAAHTEEKAAKTAGRLFKLRISDENKVVFKKLAVDIGFGGPMFNSIFFVSMGLLESRSVEDITNRVRTRVIPTIMTGWKLWIPVMFCNFKYVPLDYRMHVMNFVGVGWRCFLSLQNAKKDNNKEDEQFT